MDYEKLYKEAVGKIKELLEEKKKKEMTNCLFEGELRDIFSELCESEDEKIRKALLRFFREYQGGCPAQGFSRAEAVAWLEKQGEQKPGNKVKPKFKIGDWIINNITGFVYIVKDKGYGGYIVVNRENHQYTISTEKEKDYRLWTIQDAKAGDVLYLQKDGKEHIIIYKGVIKEIFRTFVSAYCAYNGIVDAFCFADVSRIVDIAYGGIMPATKEQRDLLFQKMKEAGYEWNAEKKELNKIEQESEERSKEDEIIVDVLYAYAEKANQNGCPNDAKRIEAAINKLKSPRHQKQWKPSEAQIKAVRLARCFVTDDFSDNPTLSEELMELEEQLKKL